jgi:hypothetical protein
MKTKNVKNPISENTRFADPDRIKTQIQGEESKDGKNSPWDYRCPAYDQRTSNFINAGTHYGVGVNQPVGHTGNPRSKVPSLPYGRINTLRDDEKG